MMQFNIPKQEASETPSWCGSIGAHSAFIGSRSTCVRPPAGDMMLTDLLEMLLHGNVHRKSCFLTFANFQISEHHYLNNETQMYKLL